MRWLAIILLVGVFVRHDTSYLASTFSTLTPGAWFTIMGGLWEVVLCATLLAIIEGYPLAIAALWIGIVEGALIAVCRAAISDISAVPQKANLCDYVTGLPIGFLFTVLEFGVVCWAIKKSWRSASHL